MIFSGPFFLKHGPCPYLPGRDWSSVSLSCRQVDPDEFQTLLEDGFRRSGSEFYRPACRGCQECVPIRLPVEAFHPHRTQRRVWRRNQDLRVRLAPGASSPQKLDLYRRFLAARFDRVESPGVEEMEGFLGDRFGSTLVLDYLLGERLVAFGVLDVTPKAASSVYFVHDPDLASRRLGTFSVMQEVEWCRKTKRSHLYLGLWVRECPAMAYKAWFHPHETLVAGTWVREPLLQ
jgi:arginyl-tRNA--protein-N-Asp/Glu arginylyltransferase